MRILLVVAVFVLGITLGYVVGINQKNNEVAQINNHLTDNDNAQNQNADENQHSNHNHSNNYDESDNSVSDSLNQSEMYQDSSDVSISTEKLIHSVQYPIIYLVEEETSGDSTMADLLGIEEVQNNSIFVEFWESPLNFEGYKLTKKKLVVYGLSPQVDYKMYKEGDSYFLSYQNVYYKMRETQDFLPLTQVSKQDVFND